MQAIALADAENRHDVGVMELGRGPGLSEEAPEDQRGPGDARREHLERDVPAERLLLGLIDDTHAAASQLAEDPEVAEPLRGWRPAAEIPPAGGRHQIALRLDVLDEE